MDKEAANRAAERRATWAIRRTDLAHEGDDGPLDPDTALAAMWQLMVDAWVVSGRPMPTYARHEAPGKVWRAGSAPPEHAR